ncbi:YebC/PmpR family DNA-binding transcriptional regulator [Anaerovirgula multivorans]|uniref:YebC/PmpR family DNA-binding transcriptional regulator n=1 Tax=Anaerovirgula multivorans TaxID=312168 RepID=UPI000B77CC39|nr:YebC/PmpR family DNA-binding transcriptional regulator [Anaerovirgula multivorans]
MINIHKEGYQFIQADIMYIPQTEMGLQNEDVKKMDKLIDMLEDNDDVQQVYYHLKET